MKHNGKSLRPFIGAKDYNLSRSFYRDLGFEETVISHNMSVFTSGTLAFYLQDYYAEEWINNTMLFMEVDNAERFYNDLLELNLTATYPTVKVLPVKHNDWGSECFVIDPSGVLWHFGEFKTTI